MELCLQLCNKEEIADKFTREYRGVWPRKKKGSKAAIKEEEEKKKRPSHRLCSLCLRTRNDEYEKPGADGRGTEKKEDTRPRYREVKEEECGPIIKTEE